MRTLTVVLALLFTCSLQAAEKPRPKQSIQDPSKKVWTNDDMAQLRSRGLISIVGQEAPPTGASAAGASATPPESISVTYESRLDDPSWYAGEAAYLQAELDKRTEALRRQQNALALAADRITQPGLSMDKPDAGVTPAAGIANLEAEVQDAQSQLDELSDLARQHNIEPGVLRG